MIKIKKFVVNPLAENSLLLYDETGEAVFIDPGFYYGEEEDEVVDFIERNNLKPLKIVNTHCHFDHIMGVEFIRNHYKIPFFAHKDDSFWIEQVVDKGRMYGFEIQPVAPADSYISEDSSFSFGNSKLQVIHVPGHSPGHLVFYSKEDGFLVAGDVLFYGSIGRTDFPGGNHNTLITGIKTKILTLPALTKVYCGHGPETTVGFEKENNPFLT